MKRIVHIVTSIYERDSVNSLIKILEQQSLVNISLIIVDHSISKQKIISSSLVNIRVICAPSHFWFTAAINTGLKEVSSTLKDSPIIILNDDILIKGEDFIANLIKPVVASPLSIVGAVCINMDTELVEYSGFKFSYLKCAFLPNKTNDSFDNDTLPTRAIAFNSNLLTHIGLLNEDVLPQYGSDYEWTIRAKKYGYKLLISSECKIYTKVDDSTRHIVSARKVYRTDKLSTFFSELFSDKKQNSVITNLRFSSLVFNPIYSLYFTMYRALKVIIGFIITNYLSRDPL